jgi:hypothetical protein
MRIKKKDIKEMSMQDTADEIIDTKNTLTRAGFEDDEAEEIVKNLTGAGEEIAEENKYSDEAQDFISKKISKLSDEGKPHDQAVAIAINMARDKDLKVPPEPKNEGISDLSQTNAAIQDASEDWEMHLQDTVDNSLKSFGLDDEMRALILSKMQHAYWDAYDEYRRSHGGDIAENDEEDYERASREVEYGVTDKDYGDLQLPTDGGIELPADDEGDGLPFESVNPKMTKDQLIETVVGKKQRKVIKTINVKDLKK